MPNHSNEETAARSRYPTPSRQARLPPSKLGWNAPEISARALPCIDGMRAHRPKMPGSGQTSVEEVKEGEEAAPHGLHETASGALYMTFVAELKQRITGARVFAARAVNGEIIRLYWDIGRLIAERQRVHGWGKSIVDRLAVDLGHESPGVRGFSARNLPNMKCFYREYSQPSIWQQLVAKLDSEDAPFKNRRQAVAKLALQPSFEILRQPVAELGPRSQPSPRHVPQQAHTLFVEMNASSKKNRNSA